MRLPHSPPVEYATSGLIPSDKYYHRQLSFFATDAAIMPLALSWFSPREIPKKALFVTENQPSHTDDEHLCWTNPRAAKRAENSWRPSRIAISRYLANKRA